MKHKILYAAIVCCAMSVVSGCGRNSVKAPVTFDTVFDNSVNTQAANTDDVLTQGGSSGKSSSGSSFQPSEVSDPSVESGSQNERNDSVPTDSIVEPETDVPLESDQDKIPSLIDIANMDSVSASTALSGIVRSDLIRAWGNSVNSASGSSQNVDGWDWWKVTSGRNVAVVNVKYLFGEDNKGRVIEVYTRYTGWKDRFLIPGDNMRDWVGDNAGNRNAVLSKMSEMTRHDILEMIPAIMGCCFKLGSNEDFVFDGDIFDIRRDDGTNRCYMWVKYDETGSFPSDVIFLPVADIRNNPYKYPNVEEYGVLFSTGKWERYDRNWKNDFVNSDGR